jgi:hypothetical protein
MSEVMVKGTPVNALVSFVTAELRPEQLASVLAQMPPEEAASFHGDQLASALVPLSAVNRYTLLAATAKAEAVSGFARRAGRYGAEQGTRTVYKFILMLVSGESALRAAPSMWRRVYDGGRLEVVAVPGGGRLTVRDFPAEPASCGRITGWFELIAERVVKGSRTTHSCRCDGAAECSWDFTW